VDAVSLRQLRSVSLDSSIADLALIQDGVVRQIATMLELELNPEAKRVIEAGGTKVATAYDAYLQGRGHLQRYQERESLERATSAFQEALQRDPTFALAYAGLGEAHWRLYELTKDRAYVDLARKACERALALNDLLAPVHVTVGLLHIGTGEAERATSDFQRALALDPASSEARRGLAQAYDNLGRTAEAEAAYRKAIALKPDYWGSHNSFGSFFFRRGRYREAEQAFRLVVELAPDNVRGRSNLGGVLSVMGRDEEAVAELQRSLAMRQTLGAASNLARIEYQRGRYSEAARGVEKAHPR
jgi:Tfp pilus assembly protein PilF